MADTTKSIEVPQNQWVDLYEVTGINRGSVLIVHNVGTADVYLATARNQPDQESVASQRMIPDEFMINDGGSFAEWAYCPNEKGLLNVRVQ